MYPNSPNFGLNVVPVYRYSGATVSAMWAHGPLGTFTTKQPGRNCRGPPHRREGSPRCRASDSVHLVKFSGLHSSELGFVVYSTINIITGTPKNNVGNYEGT